MVARIFAFHPCSSWGIGYHVLLVPSTDKEAEENEPKGEGCGKEYLDNEDFRIHSLLLSSPDAGRWPWPSGFGRTRGATRRARAPTKNPAMKKTDAPH
jgi:hypothetical protein